MAISRSLHPHSAHGSDLPTHFSQTPSFGEKSSWVSNALFFAKLYVLDLTDPFVQIYQSGCVGKFLKRQVELLSDADGIKTTLKKVAATVSEHPLDTVNVAQPILAIPLGPEAASYIGSAISAIKLYQSADLSVKDLKKIAQTSLSGKWVFIIALSSLPVVYGKTTCHYPSMVDALSDYNSPECADLTMGRIQQVSRLCRQGDCENLQLAYTYTHHASHEGFHPVSATGSCPPGEMCYLVAPSAELPPVEICWDPNEMLQPATVVQQDAPSPTFDKFGMVGEGHSIYMTKIDGCIFPSPSFATIANRDSDICHIVPYTQSPPGALILCTSSAEPHEHKVTFVEGQPIESDSSAQEFYM
ncbi:MAG: hypothetical protein K2P51_08585 [Rhabdochlamydiaceae bacterium]|nr:hypothetical protein [Rhabdochlamydiaceae bacterium]